MNVSNILKTLRTESGLTQQELSDKLNIGQATIACYENGQREPHISSLIAYADFFECSVDFLIGRTDDFGNVIVDFDKTKNSESNLTLEEQNFLTKYRALKSGAKIKLNGYIDGLSEN